MKFRNIKLSLSTYIYIFSAVNLFLYNIVFCKNLQAVTGNFVTTALALLCVFAVFNIFFNLIFWRKSTKFLSFLFLTLNAVCLYFMHTYNISIDYVMLINLLNTDTGEAFALLNFKMLVFFVFVFLLPAYIISKTNINFENSLKPRLKNIVLNFVVVALVVAPFFKVADNFYREQKHLRYYLMPTNYIGAVISFAKNFQFTKHEKVRIGDDVVVEKYRDNEKKNLIVVVVGETARAANFSLGGYERNTNEALLKYQDDFVYYKNAYSCGTATAVSVPCIFSHENQKHFMPGSELYTENLTDVMSKAKYFSVWRENNTSCQNVCNRIKIEKICKKKNCHDEILLTDVEKLISSADKDVFLILHQRGSHGPDYYNMYPHEFEKYTPICKETILNKCSHEELVNVFDNTIEYTSYFLAQTIEKLESLALEYNIMMIFASDHGESLGENGVYLHSAVYKHAPDEQKHIPFLLWIPRSTQESLKIDMNCLKSQADEYVSHDNIFHTVLGFAGAKTELYVPEYDLLEKCSKHN